MKGATKVQLIGFSILITKTDLVSLKEDWHLDNYWWYKRKTIALGQTREGEFKLVIHLSPKAKQIEA